MALSDLIALACPSISQHAADDFPYEAVGLVFEDGSIVRLVNQARAETRFLVGKDQVAEAIRATPQRPLALYHSHPHRKATPSDRDCRLMAKQTRRAGVAIPFLIYGVDGLRAWLWQDGEPTEATEALCLTS